MTHGTVNVNNDIFKCTCIYEQEEYFLICKNDYCLFPDNKIMLKVSRFCEKSFEISVKNLSEIAIMDKC